MHATTLPKLFDQFETPKAAYLLGLIAFLFLAISVLLAWFSLGNNPSLIPISKITGHCLTADSKQNTTCKIDLTPLQDGRYRLAIDNFNNKIAKFQIEFPDNTTPNNLLIQKSINYFSKNLADKIKVTISRNNISTTAQINLTGTTAYNTPQSIVSLPQALQAQTLILTLENKDFKQTTEQQKLILDQIGFTQELPSGLTKLLLGSKNYLHNHLFDVMYYLAMVACICGFFLPNSQYKVGAIYIFAFLCLTHFTALWLNYAPEWGYHDLRTVFTSGTLQETEGSNLNYGLYMASHYLQGSIPSALGIIWSRMPGYGLWLATLVWVIGDPHNLLKIALYGIAWQILLTAAALAYFYWAACKIMNKGLALIICTLLALLPHQTGEIQIESIMPAIVFFCLANSCIYLAQLQKQKTTPTLKYHLLLHLGFAVWFITRTDVLPAWFLVSLFLYAGSKQTWRYLLIPFLSCAILGSIWAGLKYPITHEYSMTTNSVGASSMVGLWEIPNKFLTTEPSDATYINWVPKHINADFSSKAASDYTMHQVIRFYFTYPGYTISLAWHKFMLFLFHRQAIADTNNLQLFSWYDYLPINIAFCLCFFISLLLISLIGGYQRNTLLLLGWPLFFNLPVFFLVFSSIGRFYMPGTISLLIIGIYLFFNLDFWHTAIKKYITSLIILILCCSLPWWGLTLDNYLIHWDAFRYSAPLLDPTKIQFQDLKS